MPSTRFVALIRGINVGRAKRVAMADLRALVEELGYRDVTTVLNSGNVVFTGAGGAAKAAAGIEAGLRDRTGVPARVTVLSAAEVDALMAENPHRAIATDPSRLFVMVFIDRSLRVSLEPLGKRRWHPDALGVGKRAAYLWCAGGMMKSELATEAGRVLGDGVTARNWATMLKIQALCAGRE